MSSDLESSSLGFSKFRPPGFFSGMLVMAVGLKARGAWAWTFGKKPINEKVV